LLLAVLVLRFTSLLVLIILRIKCKNRC